MHKLIMRGENGQLPEVQKGKIKLYLTIEISNWIIFFLRNDDKHGIFVKNSKHLALLKIVIIFILCPVYGWL